MQQASSTAFWIQSSNTVSGESGTYIIYCFKQFYHCVNCSARSCKCQHSFYLRNFVIISTDRALQLANSKHTLFFLLVFLRVLGFDGHRSCGAIAGLLYCGGVRGDHYVRDCISTAGIRTHLARAKCLQHFLFLQLPQGLSLWQQKKQREFEVS